MRVVNFGAIKDNKVFRELVKDAAATLTVEDIKLIGFTSDDDLIENNWKENPNGEDYRSRISSAGSPDLLGWTRDVLAPRIQAVFDEFSSRYGWGNPGQVDSLFRPEDNQQASAEEVDSPSFSQRQPEFYSRLARVIDGVPDRLATQPAKQWQAWLASNAPKLGVKKDEIEWSGINDYLDLRGKDKVTKGEISDYLANNGVQVKDVTLFDPDTDFSLDDWLLNWAENNTGKTADLIQRGASWDDTLAQAKREGKDEVVNRIEAKSSPARYQRYTISGGENYREVLLTLPSKNSVAGISPVQAARILFNKEYGQLTEDQQQEVKRRINDDETPQTYMSSHWDKPNVLAHLRLNDRSDVDGNRVLFVEELQSDWGQEGKKKGFGKVTRFEYEAVQENGQLVRSFRDKDEAQSFARERGLQLNEIPFTVDTGIPVAPFVTKTEGWLNLALKRVAMLAVEGGYDKVAFVNGEQSADRYDLSKQIDSIKFNKMPDGNIFWTAYREGSRVTGADSKPSELADQVGKELAEKMLAQDGPGELSGIDLKVGGEGMKTFYDQIVPQAVNKLLPKIGGQRLGTVDIALPSNVSERNRGAFVVEQDLETPFDGEVTLRRRMPNGDTVTIGVMTRAEAEDYTDNPENYTGQTVQQPGFDVTDQMRETVSQGLPMFSRRQKDSWLLGRDEVGRINFGAGAKAYDAVAALANRVLDYVKLKPISPELSRAIKRMKNEIEKVQDLTARTAELLKDIPESERQMISDVIEGELKAGVTPPQRVLNLAASMQGIMSQQSTELVRLGMLSSAAAARWDNKYLPRFYESKLGDEAKAWARAAKSLFGRQATMQGIKGDSLKARGMFETIDVADLAQWQSQGWEQRDPDFDPAADTQTVVWRDFSRTERERMGEIRDAMFRFTMGYMRTQRDIALGRLYESLSQNYASARPMPGYVQVPNTKVEGTMASRYGKLSNMWVPPEVLDQLSNVDRSLENGVLKIYRSALSKWKEGKALALDTPIPTPAGWTTMGDIQVGDVIFDENGKPCTVTFATPVQLDRKCFEVEFSDGEKIVADAEHLWFTVRQGKPGVRTTEQIAGTLKYAAGKYNAHSVPVAGSLVIPDAQLPVDPYYLGVWLGNGTSRGTEITSCEADSIEIMSMLKSRGFGIGAVRKDPRGDIVTYQVGFNDHRPRKLLLQPALRAIGVLGDKHIPTVYLRASERQRMDLLRGLMDTDGTIDKNGKVSFCTASKKLLDGFIELARSLGFKPAFSEVSKKYQNGISRAWVVRMHAPSDRPVFLLQRKRARLAAPVTRRARSQSRQIVSITPVQSVPVRCIQVSSESRLYLAGRGMIPTHNTVLNPVSHANNVISNVTQAHFAGVSYWDVQKYAGAIKDLVANSAMVEEAKDVGLFGGTFVQSEIVQSMPPQLRQLAGMSESKLSKMTEGIWDTLAFTVQYNGKKYGARPVMQWAYEHEDLFFRYLIYRDARKRGLAPEDAREFSEQYIFTYDDLPRGARVIRDAAIPFFTYSYKITPVLARTLLEYPWRFAAPAAVAYAANAAMYAAATAIAGGDDDEWWGKLLYRYATDAEFRQRARDLEKEERKNLPPWMKGASILGTPKAIRMGMDDVTGLPMFLDISRVVPGGDIVEAENNAGGLGIPNMFAPNNPILTTLMALQGNRDLFTGKDVVNKDTDTSAEQAEKRAAWAWKQFSPAIAVGNYHFNRAMNVVANVTGQPITLQLGENRAISWTGTGRDGLPTQPELAALQTVGIKLRPIDLDTSAQIAESNRKRILRDLATDMKRLQRLENKGAISPEAADVEREQIIIKRDRVRERLTVDGDEPK
jgi:hypothetical protein